jgi:hypothetical protein
MQNLQGVSVSLCGATPEVHDGITRKGWRRTWDGAAPQPGITVRLGSSQRQNARRSHAAQATAAASYMVDLTITSRRPARGTSTRA